MDDSVYFLWMVSVLFLHDVVSSSRSQSIQDLCGIYSSKLQCLMDFPCNMRVKYCCVDVVAIKSIMPRTTGSSNKRSSRPEVEYKKIKAINKFFCYNFYIHLKSDGEVGWNSDPTKKPVPSSVGYYRHSNWVFSSIS